MRSWFAAVAVLSLGCHSPETTPAPAPEPCSSDPVVSGRIRDLGLGNEVIFSEVAATVSLGHKTDVDQGENGCLNAIRVAFDASGSGCRFELAIDTHNGAMVLSEFSLVADSFCPGWDDQDEGAYSWSGEPIEADMVLPWELGDVGSSACVDVAGTISARIPACVGTSSRLVQVVDLTITGQARSVGDPLTECPVGKLGGIGGGDTVATCN